MARKAKLTVVTNNTDIVDLTVLPAAGADGLVLDVDAMLDVLAPLASPAAPIVPSLAELRAEAEAAPADVLMVLPESYTLVISGTHDSLLAAGMYAGAYAKSLGVQVCVCDASGAPVRCYDPPARRGRGGKANGGVSAGPRGADWSSRSGRAIKLMMRAEGASMDEMREITGWTFGEKYVRQLRRSFRVDIWTIAATARTKRTWRAELTQVVAHVDDDTDTDTDSNLMAAE